MSQEHGAATQRLTTISAQTGDTPAGGRLGGPSRLHLAGSAPPAPRPAGEEASPHPSGAVMAALAAADPSPADDEAATFVPGASDAAPPVGEADVVDLTSSPEAAEAVSAAAAGLSGGPTADHRRTASGDASVSSGGSGGGSCGGSGSGVLGAASRLELERAGSSCRPEPSCPQVKRPVYGIEYDIDMEALMFRRASFYALHF